MVIGHGNRSLKTEDDSIESRILLRDSKMSLRLYLGPIGAVGRAISAGTDRNETLQSFLKIMLGALRNEAFGPSTPNHY